MGLERFNIADIPLEQQIEKPKTPEDSIENLWRDYDNIVTLLEAYDSTLANLSSDLQTGKYGFLEKGKRATTIKEVRSEALSLRENRLPIIIAMLEEKGQVVPRGEDGGLPPHSPRAPRRAA